MWSIILFAAIVIVAATVLIYFTLRKFCRRKNENHVSLRFPLPPPNGDSVSMDETQYDVQIKTQRNTTESVEEPGDVDPVAKHNQVTTASSMISNKPKKLKNVGHEWQQKEMRFLFEAPPPYEEADAATPTSSDERRRMVSMKLPELLLHKAADTRLIEMLRSKHTSSGKATPLNPSTSEAEGPSTIWTSRLKHVNNAISSTPAISTTQRSLSGSTTPTSSPHTQGTSLVKTNSMVTNISTVSSVITKESRQRENAGRSSAEKALKMEKCQHRATSNLSQNIDICKNHDSKRPTVAAVVKRSDDPRNADDVPTRNS